MTQDPTTLEHRIRRLEDHRAIEQLIGRYGLAMDDRDFDAFPAIFAPDAVVHSADRVMHASGLEAIIALFRGRFMVLGPSFHFTHDKLLEFDAARPDEAHGVVFSHAEMNRKGRAMIAAIRYHDRYRRQADGWRISDRLLSFFYYVPAAEYLDALGPGLARRMRAYEEPRPAEWPEGLASWQRYYAK